MTMKFQSLGSSVGSKLFHRTQGGVPAMERTEGEKIVIARKYLEARHFVVLPLLVTRKDVCAYLGCSEGHLHNLMETDDFPKPFDIGAGRKKITSRIVPRWRMPDIVAWVEAGEET